MLNWWCITWPVGFKRLNSVIPCILDPSCEKTRTIKYLRLKNTKLCCVLKHYATKRHRESSEKLYLIINLCPTTHCSKVAVPSPYKVQRSHSSLHSAHVRKCIIAFRTFDGVSHCTVCMYLFLTIPGINSDHITNGINWFGAVSMPLEFNHRPLTSKDRVPSQASPWGICSAISDTEIGPSIIPYHFAFSPSAFHHYPVLLYSSNTDNTHVNIKVKQSRYRPGVAQRVPGS